MKIIVLASDEQWEELTGNLPQTNIERVADNIAFVNATEADAFFYLVDQDLPKLSTITTPVFVNKVIVTLKEMNAASNIYRINAWPGFLSRPVWEVTGLSEKNVDSILAQLNKKANFVEDKPGFVAAAIIAMIINEAYFALGDRVSSKEEINIAMKLGTNYPLGPFEWAERIGIKYIHSLLRKLAEKDNRYQPAPSLTAEALL